MKDIPLEKAVLLWRPVDYDNELDRGNVAVVETGSDDPRLRDTGKYPMSVGAVFAYWKDLSEEKRLLQWYIELMHVVYTGHVPVETVMAASFCIPEFRKTLSDEALSMLCETFGLDGEKYLAERG